MDHYIDIELLPDPDPDSDFSNSFLMRAVFNKLHKVLVELQSTSVGISFPHYPELPKQRWQGLGNVLRLHGAQSALQQLMQANWLMRMDDYLKVSEVLSVPDEISWVTVRRKQNKYANVERLRRRYIQRHQVSVQEAEQAYPQTLQQDSSLPYISIQSASTGQKRFPLYIEQQVAEQPVTEGAFNSYGLSKTLTLPLF